jgi:hypothetical protein
MRRRALAKRVSIEELPSHKRIGNTTYTVDCFSMPVDGCTHYFLSHFHADHYTNLRKSFKYPVLCSATTARLVEERIGARAAPLEMYREYELSCNHYVQCVEAHHCPGAVCFIFRIDGKYILHTGDFRALECFYEQNIHFRYSAIYLDNTYEGFGGLVPQEQAVHRVLDIMERKMRGGGLMPLRYEWCFCTYLVGKEKLFLSVAEYFGMSVRVDQARMRIYECYSSYSRELLNGSVVKLLQARGKARDRKASVDYGFRAFGREAVEVVDEVGSCKPFDRITTRRSPNEIRVVSMVDLARPSKMVEDSDADLAVVFCGTGWGKGTRWYDWARNRIVKKGIEIVYVPYSEHSSWKELERFKERMACDELINTVNKA